MLQKVARTIATRGADQWLFILSGTGYARINGRKHALRPNLLILIEHGDEHQVTATGRTPLRTLTLYAPPAYRHDGTELPGGRS